MRVLLFGLFQTRSTFARIQPRGYKTGHISSVLSINPTPKINAVLRTDCSAAPNEYPSSDRPNATPTRYASPHETLTLATHIIHARQVEPRLPAIRLLLHRRSKALELHRRSLTVHDPPGYAAGYPRQLTRSSRLLSHTLNTSTKKHLTYQRHAPRIGNRTIPAPEQCQPLNREVSITKALLRNMYQVQGQQRAG